MTNRQGRAWEKARGRIHDNRSPTFLVCRLAVSKAVRHDQGAEDHRDHCYYANRIGDESVS